MHSANYPRANNIEIRDQWFLEFFSPQFIYERCWPSGPPNVSCASQRQSCSLFIIIWPTPQSQSSSSRIVPSDFRREARDIGGRLREANRYQLLIMEVFGTIMLLKRPFQSRKEQAFLGSLFPKHYFEHHSHRPSNHGKRPWRHRRNIASPEAPVVGVQHVFWYVFCIIRMCDD